MPETCRVSWQNTVLYTWCILLVIYTKMKHDVRLFKKGSTAAGCSSQRLMVEYAHNEYCNMLRTVGVVISIWLWCMGIYTTLLLSTSHRRYVFLWLYRHLREISSITPMALVNAGHVRTVRTTDDKHAIIAAVERSRVKDQAIPQGSLVCVNRGCRNTSWWSTVRYCVAVWKWLNQCTVLLFARLTDSNINIFSS